MTFRLIDLFCGAGGMSLGFVDSRYSGEFKPVFALDNDQASIIDVFVNQDITRDQPEPNKLR
jgi:site-specific DNA-cytosine methylase